MLVGNALWQLVVQSDGMTKLVLLILLMMSIMCWTIFFYKLIVVRIKKRHLADVFVHMEQVRDSEQIFMLATRLSGTVPGYFLSKNLAYVQECLHKKRQEQQALLTLDDKTTLRDSAYDVVDDLMYYEDGLLSWLSTSAALSPLLGLFGTVWGLIHAFVRISEKQSADITTVAPGIAEALITTLAGLMVAIPALAMYNYLISQTGIIEQRLMTLAHMYIRTVQRLFT